MAVTVVGDPAWVGTRAVVSQSPSLRVAGRWRGSTPGALRKNVLRRVVRARAAARGVRVEGMVVDWLVVLVGLVGLVGSVDLLALGSRVS